MKKCLALLLLPVLTGCLSAHVPSTSEWNVDVGPYCAGAEGPRKFGVTRLAQVVVCSPYDARKMAVYRADNTMPLDPYNLFAAVPSRLFREPARSLLDASGKFTAVVGASSSATASHIVELTVTDLRLDCSRALENPEEREAVAEVSALVLDKNRDIVGSARASARANARDGNYGLAFSKAFADAVKAAAGAL